MIQLSTPLRLITPDGKGWCHFLIDYGIEADLMWVVFLDKDGTCWTYRNSQIRIDSNLTLGRQ